MNKVAQVVPVIVAAALSAGGDRVPVATAVAVTTALVGLAGVVVTVFGIWVAIIFPKLVGNLEGGTSRTRPQRRLGTTPWYRRYTDQSSVLSASAFVFLILSLYGSVFFSDALQLFFLLIGFRVDRILVVDRSRYRRIGSGTRYHRCSSKRRRHENQGLGRRRKKAG